MVAILELIYTKNTINENLNFRKIFFLMPIWMYKGGVDIRSKMTPNTKIILY